MCIFSIVKIQRKRSSRNLNGDVDDDDDLDLELAFSSPPSFSVDVKLQSDKFQPWFVQEMQGKGNQYIVCFFLKKSIKLALFLRFHSKIHPATWFLCTCYFQGKNRA